MRAILRPATRLKTDWTRTLGNAQWWVVARGLLTALQAANPGNIQPVAT